MPCYQLIVFAKPETSPERLAQIFRTLARVVYREQGQFRYIENFGVRPLAFPIRDSGVRYEDVRWVHALYDCAPAALSTIASVLSAEKDVLQFRHLRNREYLGEFRARMRGEKRKRFDAATRAAKELFDPDTLELGPRVDGATGGAGKQRAEVAAPGGDVAAALGGAPSKSTSVLR